MKRLAGFTTVTLLTLGSLTACGGGDSYCDTLEEKNTEFEDIGTSEADFQQLQDALEEVRDEAPSDVEGDYDTLIDAFTAIQEGNLGDVDQQAVEDASNAIAENASSECDIDLESL